MKSKKNSRTGTSEAPPQKPNPSPEQIAALAHAIWIDRGRPPGRDIDHWLEAERQLRGEIHKPAASDEIPASNRAIDPDRSLETGVERALNRVVKPPEDRSSTSL